MLSDYSCHTLMLIQTTVWSERWQISWMSSQHWQIPVGGVQSIKKKRLIATCQPVILFFTGGDAVPPLSCVCVTREGMCDFIYSFTLHAVWMQLHRKLVPQRRRGNRRGCGGGVRLMCQRPNHSWINSLLFGLATLIRTLTPRGLQISNLGAGEPKGIHTGELHQQGKITMYQIKCTIIHVQSCCIIKASVPLFLWHDQLWVCFFY